MWLENVLFIIYFNDFGSSGRSEVIFLSVIFIIFMLQLYLFVLLDYLCLFTYTIQANNFKLLSLGKIKTNFS